MQCYYNYIIVLISSFVAFEGGSTFPKVGYLPNSGIQIQ